MKIAGYNVKVSGNLADEDTVLIEDTVLFLNGKVSQTKLREIIQVQGGYDLLLDFKRDTKTAHLRRDSMGEWVIELPQPVDAVVSKMLV
ncbi:MAG: hypothetical protein AAF267_13885 [Deinococcota bacterium]